MLFQKNLPRKVRGSGNAFLEKPTPKGLGFRKCFFINPYPERFGFQEMLFQKNLTQKVWVLRNASSEKRSFNTSTPYVPCFGSKLFPPKTRPQSAVA
jgi:hypothetical protein